MKHLLFYIFLIGLFACDTASNIEQPGKNYFLKYFGDDGDQQAVDLIVNTDGTFFILGNSRETLGTNRKVYLAKANALGQLLWAKTFGDVEMEAKDFLLTADGKLAMVANKLNSNSNNMDVLLTRFALDGTRMDSVLLFTTTLNPYNEFANSITQLNDGGFMVAGYTDNVNGKNLQFAAMHLRVDKNLIKNPVWTEITDVAPILPPVKVDKAVKVIQNSKDSIFVFGHNNSYSTDYNFWAFRLGKNSGVFTGNSDQLSEFSDIGTDEFITNAIKTSQGGYLLTGISVSQNQNFNVKVDKIRFDDLSFTPSDVQYSYSSSSLGVGAAQFATAYSTASGFFVLTNTYKASQGKSDILLFKIDNLLQDAWSSPVQFGGDGEDTAAAVAELPDGHIMVLGTMNLGNPPEQFKIVLMKLNAQGKLTN